jgi:alkylated DNA repair dioxygenase AlkB
MSQLDLFNASRRHADVAIPGARYVRSFLPDWSELLAAIDREPWLNDLSRRVQHYGYRYDYKARKVTRDMYLGELPPMLRSITLKLVHDGLFHTLPDQAIVNEYKPGQGIASHVDCVPCFGDTIATLSLGGECEMEFAYMRTGEVQRTILELGSLLVLSGEARYKWTHAIRARLSDNGRPRGRRVSVTFRNVLRENL